MKLSNKILIGFFSVVFLYTISVMLEVRLTGQYIIRNSDDTLENLIYESMPIDNPRYLILHSRQKFLRIEESTDPRLEIKSFDGGLLDRVILKETRDTLEIGAFDFEEELSYAATLYINRGDQLQIEMNQAKVSLRHLNLSSLTVLQRGGYLSVNDSSVISHLRISTTDDGLFETTDARIDTIDLTAESSSIRLLKEPKVLKAVIKNASSLSTQDVPYMLYERDSTSTLRIFR